MVDRRLPCHCRPHQQGKNCACAEKSEFHHCPFNGAHRTYLSVIPGISGNSLERLLSSITFRLKLRFCVMTLEAQAAANSMLSPSCFLEVIVHRPLFPLIRLPSMMKPDPNRSESSANSTSLPFLVKT